jgi:hypothetical protein
MTQPRKGRKRAVSARVAQPEASECEAVRLGRCTKQKEPREGRHRFAKGAKNCFEIPLYRSMDVYVSIIVEALTSTSRESRIQCPALSAPVK